MAQVRLKNVEKRYGDVAAVKEVTLDIRDKEFLVLVGPSGCGKTTTLRMIAGLEEPTSGEIFIGDRMVVGVPPKARNIAMVFQNYALYPHMSVYENMAFGLKLRRYSKQEIDTRVQEAAAILNIEPYLKRKPRQLSGGQRQRVAVGRAIVRKPMVFLFDEPLSNLDAKFRVQMRTELSKLHERLQTTMVYVTHDQTEAMSLGDRIVVMKDGLVQQVADPLTMYDKPINKFVAGFIGSPPMNFMEGTIEKKNGALLFVTGAFSLKIVDTMKAALAPSLGKKVVFGVRPEDIYDKLFVTIAPPEHTVTASVELVEPMGSETYLYLKKNGFDFVAKVGSHNRPKTHGNMDLVIDMNKVHFFDPATEKTLA